MTILESCGIDPQICFKYDDMYFPYIVIWYNSNKHYYQVFYDRSMANQFYDILSHMGKVVALFSWSNHYQEYILE